MPLPKAVKQYGTHTVRQGLSDSGRYEYGNAAKAVRELMQHEWPE